jgi:hypothetical protein
MIEIYLNRTKIKLFIALSFFLVCADAYILLKSERMATEAIFGMFLFSGLMIYMIFELARKQPLIILTQAGIIYRPLKGRTIYWENIEFVEVRRVGRNRVVAVFLKNPEGMINPKKKIYHLSTHSLKISPYELCELIQLLASVRAEKRQEVIDGILAGIDLSLLNIR